MESESSQSSTMESPAGPSREPSAPLPNPSPSNSNDAPQNITDDNNGDDLLALVEAILGSDVNLDVSSKLLPSYLRSSGSIEAKSGGKGVAGVGTDTYGEPAFSIPSNLYDYIGTSESTSQRNPSFTKRNLEEFPFPHVSASLYLNKRELLNDLSRAHFATRTHPNHIFGFNDNGQLIRLVANNSMISFLEFLTENSLKSIFVGHGFNVEFLQSLIPHTVLKGFTAGYRSLSDGNGAPMSYDIYFVLPLKQVSSVIELLVPALGRSNLPRIDPRSALDVYPEMERNPGSKVALIDISNLAITLKYDVVTRKTSVLLQTPMPEFVFPLLQEAFENSRLEKEEDQKDPFFILVLVLRNWFEVWKTTKTIIQSITEWLDVKVQDFVTSKGNEVLYNDINSKLHYTHRHLSQINVEITESNSIIQMIDEQHTNFLKFTGLKSEMSIGIKEQLARLELDLKTLEFDLRLELDKIKTSSTWLSTSISLKHAEAMRIANEESRKASLALEENTAAMKVIAELNQQDTLAMKENTDAMKNNGTLLRELAQATLDSNKEVKQNGDAMRQIAEESKKNHRSK
ncbi:hypothetical protein TWF128_006104 [Orbilia oligospora]|nr:hypothetical protein TWF128_006104 [Orbilia oligospora]